MAAATTSTTSTSTYQATADRMWNYYVEQETSWFGKYITGPLAYGLDRVFTKTNQALDTPIPVLSTPIKDDTEWMLKTGVAAVVGVGAVVATGAMIGSTTTTTTSVAARHTVTNNFSPLGPIMGPMEIHGGPEIIVEDVIRSMGTGMAVKPN